MGVVEYLTRTKERFLAFLRAVQRRKNFVVLGIVALTVFVAGFLLPAIVASQPAFFKRYPMTEKYWSSWSHSTHAEVACRSCHVPPDRVSQAGYTIRMLSEFYLSALVPGRSPKIFIRPSNEACGNCHGTNRTTSPSGDLKIPHKAHVVVLKLACVKCHKYLVHSKNPEGTHTPRMATCLTCHNGRKAKSACVTCHKKKYFPLGHRNANWVIIHPTQQAKINCKGCHGWVKQWCRQCHERRPSSHVVGWRRLHAKKVASRRNCEACHKSAFCIRCHGEVPARNRKQAPSFVN